MVRLFSKINGVNLEEDFGPQVYEKLKTRRGAMYMTDTEKGEILWTKWDGERPYAKERVEGMFKAYSEIEADEIEFVREHEDMPEDLLFDAVVEYLDKKYGEKAVDDYFRGKD